MEQFIAAAFDGRWALVRAESSDHARQAQLPFTPARILQLADQPTRELEGQYPPNYFAGFFEAPMPREPVSLITVQVLARPDQTLHEALRNNSARQLSRIEGTMPVNSDDFAEFEEGS